MTEEPCAKCGGTGCYQYDHNHSTVCNACCKHDQGWWLLERSYGNHNGLYCCLAGCGRVRTPESLGHPARPARVLAEEAAKFPMELYQEDY